MASLLPSGAAALHPPSPPLLALWRLPSALCSRPVQFPVVQQRRLCAAAAAAAAPACPATAPLPAPTAEQQFVSWPGLLDWRARGVNAATAWGPKGPVVPAAAPAGSLTPEAASVAAAIAAHASQPLPTSLADAGRAVLETADPLGKAALTFRAWQAYREGTLRVGTAEAPDGPPARPAKPQLVPPRRIPPMDASPLPKPVYMLHNLAHVELNAIDLAWDTVVRFSRYGLPEAFYADFARVADDESRHLAWCIQRLRELGFDYGSMPAHNLLWEGCEMSAGDLGARLAIVPMSQEARGLDAGDRLSKRLVGLGDNRTAAIVRQIAAEERAHVAVGVTWFHAICTGAGADPGPTFRSLLLELCPGLLKGPFNDAERQLVGLPAAWYDARLWEPELRDAAAAAVAAASKAEHAGTPGAAAGSAAGSAAAALAPVAQPEKLQQIAARLATMLDLEVQTATSA